MSSPWFTGALGSVLALSFASGRARRVTDEVDPESPDVDELPADAGAP